MIALAFRWSLLLLLTASVRGLNANSIKSEISGTLGNLVHDAEGRLNAGSPQGHVGSLDDFSWQPNAAGGQSSDGDVSVDVRCISDNERTNGLRTLNDLRRKQGASDMMYTVSVCDCVFVAILQRIEVA